MNNKIQLLAWCLLISGGAVFIYFFIATFLDGYWIWGRNKTDFSVTGQFGDFVGGVVGTVFALAGTLFIFLTLYEQIRQNKRGTFESSFFEMIHLHRENVNEMRYTKYDPNTSEMRTAENRKVFRLIFKEFMDCFNEIKRFSNLYSSDNYIQPQYREHLEKIIAGKTIDISEWVLIDIAYHIVFYGGVEESVTILRHRWRMCYNDLYIDRLLQFIRLKPKTENVQRWKIWKTFYALPDASFRKIYSEFYDYMTGDVMLESLNEKTKKLVCDKAFAKYYGGHQHRLGHYFHHLFQSFNYLSFHNDIPDNDKYFYGKTLVSQLSIYEQSLLFVHSVSSIGMKWELNPDIDFVTASKEVIRKSKLITRFDLIRFLPDAYLGELNYMTYYPDVNYVKNDFMNL